MDTSFEDLIMNVIYKSLQEKTPKTSDKIDYIPYLRNQSGSIMRFARRVPALPDSNDKEAMNRKLWAVGSVYVMGRLVSQENDYDKSLELQSMIHNSSPTRTAQVIEALTPFLTSLSITKYGNFVVQAAITSASPTMYHTIFDELTGYFGPLSADTCGCWVMLALLERSTYEQRQMVRHELAIHERAGIRLNARVLQLLNHLDSVPMVV